MTNISETDRARLREALQWYWQANNLAQDGKHALAQPLAQKALQVRREILEPEEIESINALALLGWTIRDQFKYDEAEAPLRETLQLREKVLGDTHPDIGNACGYLAWLYVNKENFPQAETLFRRAADTFRKTDGELGLRYIQAVRNLCSFMLGYETIVDPRHCISNRSSFAGVRCRTGASNTASSCKS